VHVLADRQSLSQPAAQSEQSGVSRGREGRPAGVCLRSTGTSPISRCEQFRSDSPDPIRLWEPHDPQEIGGNMLTSAECRANAEQKLTEAEPDCDKRQKMRLIEAAQAWLILASQIRRIEASYAAQECASAGMATIIAARRSNAIRISGTLNLQVSNRPVLRPDLAWRKTHVQPHLAVGEPE
jgi:hypothetical protein